MSELAVFDHPEFGSVRSVMIDGDPWFVLADVCRVLEVNNPSQAATYLDEDEKKQVSGGVISNEAYLTSGNVWLINESGLYSLILRSRKPQAKAFKKWVTSDVLPSIRQTGQYSRSKSALELLRDQVDMAIAHERRMNQIEQRQDTVETRVAELSGHLDWYSAQGWAKLNGHQADNRYLQRVGTRARKLLRESGLEPGKVRHPMFGEVNSYPPGILREAFLQVHGDK